MDCLPMDVMCELQQDFAIYNEEIFREDTEVSHSLIGIFNGKEYHLGVVNGVATIVIMEQKGKSLPLIQVIGE